MHTVFPCYLLDLQCDLVRSFGDDDGSSVLLLLVLKCYGIVGRVGNDHVGVWNFGHHPLFGSLHLYLADLGFNKRIPLHIFHLVFNLLLAHLQPVEVALACYNKIN